MGARYHAKMAGAACVATGANVLSVLRVANASGWRLFVHQFVRMAATAVAVKVALVRTAGPAPIVPSVMHERKANTLSFHLLRKCIQCY